MALQVPGFLDCDGPSYLPIWSLFRDAARLNALAGYPFNETLRQMAAELIAEHEPNLHLGVRAWVVQLRSAATGDAFRLKRSVGDDATFTVPGEKDSEADAMGFCLYGYVQALFIEYRHSSLGACRERHPLLQVAQQLLGGETHETDFLESSNWPVRSLDLHLSELTTYRAHKRVLRSGIQELLPRDL